MGALAAGVAGLLARMVFDDSVDSVDKLVFVRTAEGGIAAVALRDGELDNASSSWIGDTRAEVGSDLAVP
jgi:hypothetical protein